MSAGRPLANIADTAGNTALGSPSGHRAASALPPLRSEGVPPNAVSFQQSPARAPARAERPSRTAVGAERAGAMPGSGSLARVCAAVHRQYWPAVRACGHASRALAPRRPLREQSAGAS